MDQRIMADAVGAFCALVLEMTIPNMGALKASMPKVIADKEWRANYQKFSALAESGYREVFTIVG
jgi:hypothetical protein